MDFDVVKCLMGGAATIDSLRLSDSTCYRPDFNELQLSAIKMSYQVTLLFNEWVDLSERAKLLPLPPNKINININAATYT